MNSFLPITRKYFETFAYEVKTMIYDIRTSEKALKTLVNLTGVAEYVWLDYVYRTIEYPYTEK